MAASAASPPTAASPTASVDVKPNAVRQPSLIMKPTQTPPAASPLLTSATTNMSLTTKEWVIPPRPKPGRKPATDTPPSKRKAQNRAAQRAFRERRAARVNELEDQIKIIDDENERGQEVLRSRVNRLEKEVEQYRAELAHWVDQCRKLENELKDLRIGRAVPGNMKAQVVDHDSRNSLDTSVGCGKCTLETRCQCIDEAFDAVNGASEQNVALEKRARSPDHSQSSKRIKTEPKEAMEIDFTALYSKSHHPTQAEQSPTPVVADPCGFCTDGSPCLCAMAAEQEASSITTMPRPVVARTDIPHQLSEFTPPPSEGDVVQSQPCANGPGTCIQCRADPNSTAFCKSLAASRSQSGSQSHQGCCGGRTPGGSCCSSQAVPLPSRTTRSRAAASSSMTSQKPITLTCADAYTTLSRHPAYSRATDEIASWLPKLHASDVASDAKSGASEAVHGRPAMEIDAANVMAVLKDFDRRFGKSA